LIIDDRGSDLSSQSEEPVEEEGIETRERKYSIKEVEERKQESEIY
jgi:hypothetical protein